MRKRQVVVNGIEFILVARGPEENLDKALDAVEALIGNADFVVSGLLDAHDCSVSFAKLIPNCCPYGA